MFQQIQETSDINSSQNIKLTFKDLIKVNIQNFGNCLNTIATKKADTYLYNSSWVRKTAFVTNTITGEGTDFK